MADRLRRARLRGRPRTPPLALAQPRLPRPPPLLPPKLARRSPPRPAALNHPTRTRRARTRPRPSVRSTRRRRHGTGVGRLNHSAVGASCSLGESLRVQPVIELIDPVVARRALFAQAEAVPARVENVDFGFMTRCSQ